MCPRPNPLPEVSYFTQSLRLGFGLWNEARLDQALKLWGDPAVTRLFSTRGFKENRIKERLTTALRFQKHLIWYQSKIEIELSTF